MFKKLLFLSVLGTFSSSIIFTSDACQTYESCVSCYDPGSSAIFYNNKTDFPIALTITHAIPGLSFTTTTQSDISSKKSDHICSTDFSKALNLAFLFKQPLLLSYTASWPTGKNYAEFSIEPSALDLYSNREICISYLGKLERIGCKIIAS